MNNNESQMNLSLKNHKAGTTIYDEECNKILSIGRLSTGYKLEASARLSITVNSQLANMYIK